jgi:hypothetical protein
VIRASGALSLGISLLIRHWDLGLGLLPANFYLQSRPDTANSHGVLDQPVDCLQ